MESIMKSKFLTRVALATAFGAALPVLSGAAVYSNGSKTTTFDVTLKIIADCTIAANTLDFGQSQGVLATAVNVNTTLNVTCTNTTPYNIGLNAGTGTGSTVAFDERHRRQYQHRRVQSVPGSRHRQLG
jgi:spore coat protein U-like protein